MNTKAIIRKISLATLAGSTLLAACDKKGHEPDDKDAVAYITVVDEKGEPQGGMPVLVYDEKGYEKFQQDRNTEPKGFVVTLPDGKVRVRLAYQEWFTAGNRQVTFVIREETDPDNYRIWAIGRTARPGEELRIDFKLDRKPAVPDVPFGNLLEMFDENNGRTLFAEGIYLDAGHHLVGSDRYSFVDAGAVSGLEDLGALKIDRFQDRIAVQPGHGYFVCKDISLMEFPSGKWGLAISSEFARMHLEEWILRDGEPVGARLRYAVQKPENHGLPEWGHLYEVKSGEEGSVTIPLPADAPQTECAPRGDAPLRFSFAKDHVTVHIADPGASAGKEYRFVIRAGACYTEAKLKITV